ncbi:MAG: hypothetical protein Q9M89_06875 [Persephonella sp.]|nr:hypothetical protein [Persephonella sp.]
MSKTRLLRRYKKGRKVPVSFSSLAKDKKIYRHTSFKVIKESLKHGVKKAKVENFIIDSVITFEPEMTIAQAEKIISRSFPECYPSNKKKVQPVGVINQNIYNTKALSRPRYLIQKRICSYQEKE